ncbi:MAG TPA: ThiF family adenylyltransferase [Planctomycetota bacterium]|jgi:molybdopterin/thiamine biosynthesis adenylyltransferase|nr:ThiF family adenylyltransferase [Planctomycetota bacterium]
MIRLAMTEVDRHLIESHFRSLAPRESGAFLLLFDGASPRGPRLVASRPYFPGADEWEQRGEHQLTPSARLISAMVSFANAMKAGLLFIHSHPNPLHPTAFSRADENALASLAEVMPDLLDGSFAAAVVGPQGWVGRVYRAGRWLEIERITAAGAGLRILSPLGIVDEVEALDDRQVKALGSLNQVLRNLDVAIVGCGGLGSPLAETVTRMGVRRLTPIDFDLLDTPSNVRRVFGARMADLAGPPVPKASIVARNCRFPQLATEVTEIHGDIRRPVAFRHMLDADVVFCGTDSHSSRAVIDAASIAYNLPVIDCGVRVGLRDGHLSGLLSELRLLGPGRPCLWCRGTLSAERIRAENLPPDQRRKLAAEGYLVGIAAAEPSVTALTVFGAGMMASALLGLLSPDSDLLWDTWLFDAFLGDAPTGKQTAIDPACICQRRAGLADRAALGLMPDATQLERS